MSTENNFEHHINVKVHLAGIQDKSKLEQITPYRELMFNIETGKFILPFDLSDIISESGNDHILYHIEKSKIGMISSGLDNENSIYNLKVDFYYIENGLLDGYDAYIMEGDTIIDTYNIGPGVSHIDDRTLKDTIRGIQN